MVSCFSCTTWSILRHRSRWALRLGLWSSFRQTWPVSIVIWLPDWVMLRSTLSRALIACRSLPLRSLDPFISSTRVGNVIRACQSVAVASILAWTFAGLGGVRVSAISGGSSALSSCGSKLTGTPKMVYMGVVLLDGVLGPLQARQPGLLFSAARRLFAAA